MLRDNREILYSTDGGAKDNKGSYGWVIGTAREELWANNGQVTGQPIHSFRSESVAVISLVLFLRTYIQYHRIPTTNLGITILTDSQSLMRRWTRLERWAMDEWWPSVWMWPDIDTTAELLQISTTLPFTLHFEHVPSHQDDRIPFTQLINLKSILTSPKTS